MMKGATNAVLPWIKKAKKWWPFDCRLIILVIYLF